MDVGTCHITSLDAHERAGIGRGLLKVLADYSFVVVRPRITSEVMVVEEEGTSEAFVLG